MSTSKLNSWSSRKPPEHILTICIFTGILVSIGRIACEALYIYIACDDIYVCICKHIHSSASVSLNYYIFPQSKPTPISVYCLVMFIIENNSTFQ